MTTREQGAAALVLVGCFALIGGVGMVAGVGAALIALGAAAIVIGVLVGLGS